MQTTVKAALARVMAGTINFPTYLKAIAAAGVKRYAVDIATHTITFQSAGKTVTEQVPGSITISDRFNKTDLLAAIRDSLQGDLRYPAFLHRIAQAGVQTYAVELSSGAVIYAGHGQTHIEPIPGIVPPLLITP